MITSAFLGKPRHDICGWKLVTGSGRIYNPDSKSMDGRLQEKAW